MSHFPMNIWGFHCFHSLARYETAAFITIMFCVKYCDFHVFLSISYKYKVHFNNYGMIPYKSYVVFPLLGIYFFSVFKIEGVITVNPYE